MKRPPYSPPRSTASRRWLFAVLLGIFSLHTEAKPAKELDIADTIATNRIMTKFAAILQGSDLATFLSSRGPFTVFVPTDAAFAKLPPGTMETLLLPENKERLQDILLYHVVNGKKLTSKDLLTTTSVLSCAGSPTLALTIRTSKSGTQYVLKAKIIHSDIKCQNGIINEIDTLLVPPEKSLPPLLTAAPPNTNAPSAIPPIPPIGGTNAAPDSAQTNGAPNPSIQ